MKSKIVNVLFWLVMLALWCSSVACASTTKLGVTYTVNPQDTSILNTGRISSSQIDAALIMSQELWGKVDPGDVYVIFWDKPISYGQEKLSGATWGAQINVYLKSGSEGCLFNPDNSGSLVHELGHALLYLNGDVSGDPTHSDPRWSEVENLRSALFTTFCTPR